MQPYESRFWQYPMALSPHLAPTILATWQAAAALSQPVVVNPATTCPVQGRGKLWRADDIRTAGQEVAVWIEHAWPGHIARGGGLPCPLF